MAALGWAARQGRPRRWVELRPLDSDRFLTISADSSSSPCSLPAPLRARRWKKGVFFGREGTEAGGRGRLGWPQLTGDRANERTPPRAAANGAPLAAAPGGSTVPAGKRLRGHAGYGDSWDGEGKRTEDTWQRTLTHSCVPVTLQSQRRLFSFPR